MKKKILGLVIFLIGIGASFAMDVAPLYFVDAQGNRIAANLQQEYWNYLVKYKLFGNDFVKTGNRVIIHDESGWTGSNGYFKAEQPDGQGASVGTQLGGPIVVAGKITTGDGYKFTTGPIRGGSFESGQNCNDCYYAAPICLDNTSVTGGGTAGFQAQPISNCPDQPSPNTAVSIPLLDWPASPTVADIKISANNGEQRIVVPDPVDGSKAPYDMYMDSILTGIGGTDGAIITVSMPAGGRVTRIFVHQIQLGNHTVIQIVYRTPQEDGSVVEVPAEKYVGNLLFYTDHDINIKNTDNSTLLGTYVSTGRIYLQSNINFAGQLIANELVVGNEFDGRSFVFVPIDPPVLDLKPQADTPLEFPENDLLVKVPIALDTPAPADVFIDYCFDLQNSSAGSTDFFLDTIDGRVYSHSTDGKKYLFPICGQNMGKVTILKDAKTPADAPDVSVWINVAKDEEVERPNETLRLKITNISGAVLPGNKLDGYFDLIIVDANIEPTSENFEITATEDEVFTFDSSMFKYESAFDKVEQGVVIMSLPEKGFLLSNGDTLTSSDLNKFIPINETTNIDLQFIAAKDEYGVSPAYTSFTFKMKDADNVVSEKPYTVTVKVNPVNDKPIAHDTVYTINENVAAGTAAAGKIRMEDVDDTKFTYAFDTNDPKYTTVDNLFEINSTTGEITVKNAGLDYEGLNADTTMVIKVIVTDAASTSTPEGAGKLADTSNVTIKVVDVNEAPEITKKGPFAVDENAEAGALVDTVKATDPDIRNIAFSTLTFSIVEADVPFVIHPQTGVITVAAEADLDFEKQTSWTIHAIVTDGHLSDTAEVVININDLNEPPVIEDISGEYNVVENTANDVVIASIKISDQDGADDRTALVATLENYLPSSGVTATDLFEATVVEADGQLKIVITVKDSEKLDYEALLANGADTVSFDVRLLLTDRSGADGSFTDTAFTTIYVTDENEAPTVEDAEFAVNENSEAGDLVGVVVASDPDTAHAVYGTLYYSLLDSTVGAAALFSIDDAGKITVASGTSLDYESDSVFYVKVRVTDNEYSDTATVKITLKDVNENPEFACIVGDANCNGPFNVFENSKKDSVIHEFAFVDVDAGDRGLLTTFVTGVSANGADTLFTTKFNADSTIVQLVVLKGTNLDYEALDASYDIIITVQDDEGLNDTLIRKINLVDVNEAPVLADRNFTPDENIATGDVVGEMVVDEPDTKNEEFRHLDYSIITPDMPFAMDGNKVVVTDADKLNFEIQAVFSFQVEVRNCEKNATTGEYTEKCLADTADVKVTLQNVNENPEIACKAGDANCNGPFAINENSATGTEIHTFAISDVDADDAGKLTATLSDNGATPTGADSLFTVVVNATNTEVSIVVKDGAKLDFEKINAKHEVVITVSDAAGLTDTLIRTINVVDVNEAPVIADSAFEPDENLSNGDVVGEMVVDEPDTKNEEFRHLDYAVITPDMPFAMSGNKVVVTDADKLDFETSPVFTFLVEVKNCTKNATTGLYTEGCLADTANVTVTLQDVNENPEIKCFAGDAQCNGPFTVNENTKTGYVIHPFSISDVDAADAGKLTAVLSDNGTSGADSLFTVVLSATNDTVYVVVKDSSKLDFEKINPKHEVIITLTDAAGLTDTLIRTINVVDVNEAPTIDDFNKTIEENLPNGSVVGELVAKDPDVKNVSFSTLTYAIVEQDVPFILDGNIIKVSDSEKLNYEEDSTITFRVTVSDGEFTDTAKVTIKLSDVNETPKIVVDDDDDGDDDTEEECIANCDTTGRGHDPVTGKTLTVGIDENSADNTVVFAYVVADEDAGDVGDLTPSLKDNNNTGVDSLFKVGMKTEGGKTKVVVSVKNGSKLDYEKVKLEHEVTVFITDPDGLQDSIVRIIKVQDVNEAPTVKDFTKTIAENLPNNSVVGELEAMDPDVLNKEFSTLTYTILENDVPFYLDSNVIKVADSDKLNYEKDSVFTFHVKVSDGTNSATASVMIKLSNEDEKPKIIVDDDEDGDDDTEEKCIANCDTTGRGHDPVTKKTLTVGVNENSSTNTVVFSYVVADEDIGEVRNLTPTLKDDNNSGTDSLFKIEMKQDGGKWKVVVSVKDSAKLDYETIDPIHEVTVVITDPNGLQDSIKRVIEVIDLNEPPTFESWPFEFVEHNEPGTVVGHVEHGEDVDTMAISGISKPENYIHDKFELTGGADGADTLFTLLPNGDLVANKTFNFETDPTEYTIYISLMDTLMPELVETDTIHISLLDLNEDPWIITDSVRVEENVEKGTVVDTVKAEDLDLYDTVLTFSLVEDKSGCFDVAQNGVVTVKVDNCTELDYEKNTELPIKVKVTDTKGESETKTIFVKITDVNEAPTVDDETITVSEDTPIGTPVDTVKAVDPDKDPKYNELVYTIVGGDSSVFQVDSTTGVVTLIDSLDYETKTEYTLVIEVFDGEFRDTATVTVKVGNVVESPEVNITRAETKDSSWTNPDTLYLNTSDICIDWMAKNKKSGTVLKDTTECMELDEGENIIVKKFDDPGMDYPGYDTLVVYVSKATPIVSIRKAVDDADVPNIFTVVEESEKSDTSYYVNERKNDIIVTVTDPVSGSKESFTTKIELDTLKVPSKTFTGTMSDITDFGLALSDNPSSGTSSTPVNGEKIAVSYTEVVNGHMVTVTYYTDDKGEMLVNADGVAEMTVAYKDTIGGHEVTISYQADAVTGAVIKTSGGYARPEDPAIESSSSGKGGSSSSSSDKDNKSSSSKGGDSKKDGDKKFENEVVFTVSYETVDEAGNAMTVSYGVDAEGNIVRNEDGNIGYLLTYTYKNKFGNTGTQSLFIVLDQVPPKVKILYPTEGEVIYSNFVDVKWTVDIGDGNGPIVQDTLITQSLNKGGNAIVRFYRDKAGNEASDTIRVIMKNAKDVDIAIEKPVTEVTQDLVAEYYATHEPEDNQTFAVTIYNPKTDREVETIIGGDFDNKPGTGEEPYPGLPGHLGPTLGIETKVPTVNSVGGLATLDDIIGKDGLVPLEGVEANSSKKVTVEEYVRDYCTDEFAENVGSDLSRVNLFKTKMYVKIWIYTTLGDFVDYYSFTQDLDNPDYMNDAGLLTLYFEMKPDRDGNVRTASGRLLGTGAYVYRTEVEMKSTLRCSVPPFTQSANGVWEPEKPSNKVGSARSVKEDLLKNFGYKRPEKK